MWPRNWLVTVRKLSLVITDMKSTTTTTSTTSNSSTTRCTATLLSRPSFLFHFNLYHFVDGCGQTPELQAAIVGAHKAHLGMSEWDVEASFLEIASRQAFHEVTLHACKEDKGTAINLAVGGNGLSVDGVMEEEEGASSAHLECHRQHHLQQETLFTQSQSR